VDREVTLMEVAVMSIWGIVTPMEVAATMGKRYKMDWEVAPMEVTATSIWGIATLMEVTVDYGWSLPIHQWRSQYWGWYNNTPMVVAVLRLIKQLSWSKVRLGYLRREAGRQAELVKWVVKVLKVLYFWGYLLALIHYFQTTIYRQNQNITQLSKPISHAL
jgi:hypothetical protein